MYHHELVFCDMGWTWTRTIRRKILHCKENSGRSVRLELPEWASPKGKCSRYPFLGLIQGYTDPRVFFSPLGEPLMIVGTNSKTACLGQFVVDLRTYIPDLAKKMEIEDVPIRFKEITELPRKDRAEVEKNWFMLYDENNRVYVQHDYDERSLSPVFGEIANIAPPTPQCLMGLKEKFNMKDAANDIHQATNSLRVTLCDFPCVPTIHNTVLVEIVHVKFKNYYELFYRRYAVVMNATAPFEIIGRTGNLMYAGTDEHTMIYTVSMGWDPDNFRVHEPWDEAKHGAVATSAKKTPGRPEPPQPPSAAASAGDENEDEEVDDGVLGLTDRLKNLLPFGSGARRARRTRRDEGSAGTAGDKTTTTAASSAASSSTSSAAPSSTSSATSSASATSTTSAAAASGSPVTGSKVVTPAKTGPPANSLVSKYYHGWLNDVIIINIGLNDVEGAVLHVTARNLLDCIHLC
ncbi:uncharacterized protein V1510DRAFT_409957 [Dipodascopsis tothii]|uniref:uncharacterized protein n=1 Tax=Dipodascopsis tothii TaxID=44089 RepID=UPI0034CF6281